MRDLLRWFYGWLSSELPVAGPADLCFHDETLTRTTMTAETLSTTTMTAETISRLTLIDEALELC